jgi:hypothetical protein
MKNIKKLLVLVVLISGISSNAPAQESRWTLDMEGGLLVPGYNDVQIPNNDNGTRFSLKDDLGIDNKVYYRLRLSCKLGRKHELSLLYAPLSVNASGNLKTPVNFQDVRFEAGTEVTGLYRFNSYRLTYRYRLVARPSLDVWIGFTAKIRDAEIKIESASQVSSKTNVGFVPLLHFYMDWQWGSRWGMVLEADALAAKQGRAEDVSATVYYRLKKNVRFKMGYRFVEGGSNGDEVYNFAFINYLSAGMVLDF